MSTVKCYCALNVHAQQFQGNYLTMYNSVSARSCKK